MANDPPSLSKAFPGGVPLEIGESIVLQASGTRVEGRLLGGLSTCGVGLGMALIVVGTVGVLRSTRWVEACSRIRLVGGALLACSICLAVATPFLVSLQTADLVWIMVGPAGTLALALLLALCMMDWRKSRASRCPRCGHELLAVQSECTECGADRHREARRRDRLRRVVVAGSLAAAAGAFVGLAALRFVTPLWIADVQGSVAVARFGRFLEVSLQTTLDRPSDTGKPSGIVPRGPVRGTARMLGATNRKLPKLKINGTPRDLEIGAKFGYEDGIEEFRRLATLGKDGGVRTEPGTSTTKALRSLLEGLDSRQRTGRAEPWSLPIEQVSWTVAWIRPVASVHWASAIGAVLALGGVLLTVRVGSQR